MSNFQAPAQIPAERTEAGMLLVEAINKIQSAREHYDGGHRRLREVELLVLTALYSLESYRCWPPEGEMALEFVQMAVKNLIFATDSQSSYSQPLSAEARASLQRVADILLEAGKIRDGVQKEPTNE